MDQASLSIKGAMDIIGPQRTQLQWVIVMTDGGLSEMKYNPEEMARDKFWLFCNAHLNEAVNQMNLLLNTYC